MNLLKIRNRYRKIMAKRNAHRLIRRRLGRDPVLAMLAAAPLADEPASDDELESLRVGWDEYHAGLTVSAEEVRQAFRERRHVETR